MALSQEDLTALAGLIDQKVSAAVDDVRRDVEGQVTKATTPQPQTNDEPQNQEENQPEFYVHLANGNVLTSRDSQSTHMTDEAGASVAVIGRYPMGE